MFLEEKDYILVIFLPPVFAALEQNRSLVNVDWKTELMNETYSVTTENEQIFVIKKNEENLVSVFEIA